MNNTAFCNRIRNNLQQLDKERDVLHCTNFCTSCNKSFGYFIFKASGEINSCHYTREHRDNCHNGRNFSYTIRCKILPVSTITQVTTIEANSINNSSYYEEKIANLSDVWCTIQHNVNNSLIL
jgi:hypothetical protein